MRVLKTLVAVVVAERIDRKVVEPFSGVLGEFAFAFAFLFHLKDDLFCVRFRFSLKKSSVGVAAFDTIITISLPM